MQGEGSPCKDCAWLCGALWHQRGVGHRLKKESGGEDRKRNSPFSELKIRHKLIGPDRRALGRADEVVAEVLEDPSLCPRVDPLLHGVTEAGSPAMRGRGRKLLERLSRAS